MANQALIQAAQRMYSAKAKQTDYTPLVSSVTKGIANISKAVTEKRAEQEERTSKQFKSFNEIVIQDPDAAAKFTNELESMQDDLYKATVQAEGVLVGKDKKEIARNEINSIQNRIQAYKEDFNAIDLAYTQPSSYSDFNDIGEVVDDTSIKEESLAKRLTYKEDGVYTTNHKGEEVRLKDFKPLAEINIKGFEALDGYRNEVIKGAKSKLRWNDVESSLTLGLNKLMLDKNWGSILFDKMDGYDWATQQMIQEGIENREVFKKKVKENPDYYKQEYISDVKNAFKMDYDDTIAEQELESTAKPGRSRDPLSEARIAEINMFKDSVNRSAESGKDITFPSGEIGKITSGGNIQLYSKTGEKLEMLPISLDEAMDRAKIPLDMRGDVKPIESKASTKGGRYSQYKN